MIRRERERWKKKMLLFRLEIASVNIDGLRLTRSLPTLYIFRLLSSLLFTPMLRGKKSNFTKKKITRKIAATLLRHLWLRGDNRSEPSGQEGKHEGNKIEKTCIRNLVTDPFQLGNAVTEGRRNARSRCLVVIILY